MRAGELDDLRGRARARARRGAARKGRGRSGGGAEERKGRRERGRGRGRGGAKQRGARNEPRRPTQHPRRHAVDTMQSGIGRQRAGLGWGRRSEGARRARKEDGGQGEKAGRKGQRMARALAQQGPRMAMSTCPTTLLPRLNAWSCESVTPSQADSEPADVVPAFGLGMLGCTSVKACTGDVLQARVLASPSFALVLLRSR